MIWFPHAGGTSAAVVRQTLGQSLAVESWVAVLPGREERWNEHPRNVESIVDEFDQAIDAETDCDVVLAGHSFGGLLAYLVAEKRCRDGNPPRALMPIAIAPPDRIERTSWNQASDHELIDHLDHSYGAIPPALKDNPEALRQFLPVVRHDLRLMETYHHHPSEPLPVNVIACGGHDDSAVDQTTLKGWRRFTQANFQLEMFPGDHFFPYPNFAAITELAGRS